MKNLYQMFILFIFSIMLTGCITVDKQTFSFDYKTGLVDITLHDFRSVKGIDEDDYSLENDYDIIKDDLPIDENEEEFKIFKSISSNLFQEGETLSGKIQFELTCASCAPNKLELFEFLNAQTIFFSEAESEDLQFQLQNNQLFLFFPSGVNVESTNGILIKSENTDIIVWDIETDKFEYVIKRSKKSTGESLLPLYLKDQNKLSISELQPHPIDL